MFKKFFLLSILLSFISPIIPSAKAEDVPIFSKSRLIQIGMSKCNLTKNNPSARSLPYIDKSENTIHWKWENKRGTWCGWQTYSLPKNDFSEYLNGVLVLEFQGTYDGNPPEVKFVDLEGKHTSIVNFGPFMTGDPATGSTVKIPFEAFGLIKESKFAMANEKKIKALQLNAEYNSDWGNIKISYIGIRYTPNK